MTLSLLVTDLEKPRVSVPQVAGVSAPRNEEEEEKEEEEETEVSIEEERAGLSKMTEDQLIAEFDSLSFRAMVLTAQRREILSEMRKRITDK